jgi:hypothetical protein
VKFSIKAEVVLSADSIVILDFCAGLSDQIRAQRSQAGLFAFYSRRISVGCAHATVIGLFVASIL